MWQLTPNRNSIIAIAVAVIVTVTVVFLHTPDRLLSDERTHLNHQISASLDALKNNIEIDLKNLSYSTLFIVDQARLHEPFTSDDDASLFAEDFLSMLNTSQLYDQLRLIDISGMEVIRANYNRGNPSLADEHELQNKSNRYYFQETINLKEHECFLSPLDLNVENGVVEQPLKPTLRIGMPTFDHLGNKQGIIIVNALADQLINHFLERSELVSAEKISWLNGDGFWLAGESEERLWGFMFDERKQISMEAMQPAIWNSIKRSGQGIITNDQGTYLFTTVSPYSVFSETAEIRLNRDNPYEWKLVAYYSNDYFDALIAEKRFNSRLILLLSCLLLITLLLLFISWYYQHQTRAATEKREQVKESERLRMKSTGIIAGGIAHEFNNILSAITANLYLLKTDSTQTSQMRATQAMDRLVDRAARLVKYLLTFSRHGFVSKETIALSDITREVVQQSVEKLPASYTCNLHIDPDIHITADGEKIVTMIREVINNAIDALEGCDQPIFSVGLCIKQIDLKLDGEPEGVRAYALLTVEDNGEGISRTNLKHVYDPFFTTKEVGKASGLGLSAVLGTVKTHHGEIKIASRKNEGTRVSIYLPLTQPESDIDRKLN